MKNKDSNPGLSQESKATKTIENITAPGVPPDYEQIKSNPAPREFVKKLGDTLVKKINSDLIDKLNTRFSEVDDNIGTKHEDLSGQIQKLSESFDTSGSNEWVF